MDNELERARERIRSQQRSLAAGLTGAGPIPQGFDVESVQSAASALRCKKTRESERLQAWSSGEARGVGMGSPAMWAVPGTSGSWWSRMVRRWLR